MRLGLDTTNQHGDIARPAALQMCALGVCLPLLSLLASCHVGSPGTEDLGVLQQVKMQNNNYM